MNCVSLYEKYNNADTKLRRHPRTHPKSHSGMMRLAVVTTAREADRFIYCVSLRVCDGVMLRRVCLPLTRSLRGTFLCSYGGEALSYGGFHRSLYQTPRPTAQRYLHATPTVFGLRDSLKSAYNSAVESVESKQERQIFELQMSFLSDEHTPIDGNVFLNYLDRVKTVSGMKGIRQNLPWTQNNLALKDIQDQEAILNAMAPEERRKLGQIPISSKKRIARSTGQTLDAVENIITQIMNMQIIQEILKYRAKHGLLPPETSKELQAVASNPPPRATRKIPRQNFTPKIRPGVKPKRRR